MKSLNKQKTMNGARGKQFETDDIFKTYSGTYAEHQKRFTRITQLADNSIKHKFENIKK